MVMLEKAKVLTLNAKTIGSGEKTVVLAHGFGGDQSVWEYVLPEIANFCKVLVFDLNFSAAVDRRTTQEQSKPNVYDAFADDLISLLDSFSFKDVLFVGHSMSGMIGCLASIKRPDLFGRLLLLCASPRYLNSADYEGGFEREGVEGVFLAIESSFEAWARAFAAIVVGQSYPTEVAKFGKLLLRMGSQVALPLAGAVFLSDFTDMLGQVKVPCTIVNGTRDLVVPISVADYIRRKVNGPASLVNIDFEGHFPQLTAPQPLIEVILRLS
ncbi:alpha/beta-Hydrolases superfamily protein [Wolffia australiana]